MSTDDFLARFGAAGQRQPDPVAAAQKAMRNALPSRFYERAAVLERDGLFHVALDGRTARTPARNALAVASRPIERPVSLKKRAACRCEKNHRFPSNRPHILFSLLESYPLNRFHFFSSRRNAARGRDTPS
jgi:hypothetical protein